jgi:tRNA(Met) C34 N-acetyltransferase TmcA
MKLDRSGSVPQWGESLFHNDPLTSTEYFDSLKRTLPMESEKRLMLAVLQDAVECYQKYLVARRGKDKNLFSEAEAWILEQDNRSAFSFDNVCDSLGLAPNYVRAGLLKNKTRLLSRRHEREPSGTDSAPKGRRLTRKRRAA